MYFISNIWFLLNKFCYIPPQPIPGSAIEQSHYIFIKQNGFGNIFTCFRFVVAFDCNIDK